AIALACAVHRLTSGRNLLHASFTCVRYSQVGEGEVMIHAEKMTKRPRTGSARWSTPTRRSFHRQTAAAGRPAIEAGSISVDRRLLVAVRDWAIITRGSLADGASAACAHGVGTGGDRRQNTVN